MKTVTDNNRFNDLQLALLDHIVRYLYSEIESAELSTEKSLQLLEGLVFGVASMIDGVMVIEQGDEPLTPNLTFIVGDDENEELLVSDNGTGMHVYAGGATQEFMQTLRAPDCSPSEAESALEEELDGDGPYYRIILTFVSGIKCSIEMCLLDTETELADELCTFLGYLVTGDNEEASRVIRASITKDICQAFLEIDTIKYYRDDQEVCSLEGVGLSSMSIMDLGARVHRGMVEANANNLAH